MNHDHSPVQSRNEYGPVHAEGHAHVVVGNVYQQPAVLTKEQRCCQTFKTSSYEKYKDRNPPRVAGTCQWVLDHPQFREWRSGQENTLLWISADPGCGKSVLSKFLVDEGLCSDDSSTVCYFFFKDNEEQDNLATALCALLHQLFSRRPKLVRHAIPAWEKNGDRLREETQEMWRILQASIADRDAGLVFFVMDALDECKDIDRRQLIQLLCELHQTTRNSGSTGSLKVLVTSRPYNNVQRWFEQATSRWPSIRLRGEDENDQIHQEINSVIKQRVQDLTDEFTLSFDVRERLQQQLIDMQHRTYLWLYLAIEEVYEIYRDSIYPDEIQITSLPTSVEDAYERILSKIQERQKPLARQVLLIIVGARRPLSISEMALALSTTRVDQQNRSSLTPINPVRLKEQIREQCGLFVFINHSQLFLIHQTAKEFLVARSSHLEQPLILWKSCLHESLIEREMTKICVSYLHLSHDHPRCDHRCQQTECSVTISESIELKAIKRFWKYCAEYWTLHLQDDFLRENEWLLSQVLSLFNTSGDLFARWFPIMWKMIHPHKPAPQLGDQHVIAMTGHAFALQKILKDDNERTIVNAESSEGDTALQLAVRHGHEQVVQLLLDRGANVNARGDCVLEEASLGGYEQIVQLLLERGADIKACGGHAIAAASQGGHKQIVQLLLERGADIKADGSIALWLASNNGHEQIVKLLLERGADVRADGRNALAAASQWGHKQIAQQLLERGADIKADGSSALLVASSGGYEQVVQLLLDQGADVNAKGEFGATALVLASEHGHEKIVKLLFEQGADINAVGRPTYTALQAASSKGYKQVVQLLIERGADVNTEGEYGTALYLASGKGHKQIVQQLLEQGADINARGGLYSTALNVASFKGYKQIVLLLLEQGADTNAKVGDHSTTALYIAAAEGHEQVVQLLLERGADVNAHGGQRYDTALQVASDKGHEQVVQLLQRYNTHAFSRTEKTAPEATVTSQ